MASPQGRTRIECGYPNCHKSFGRKPDMLRHQKEKHKPPKTCSQPGCSYSARRKGRLTAHTEKAHGYRQDYVQDPSPPSLNHQFGSREPGLDTLAYYHSNMPIYDDVQPSPAPTSNDSHLSYAPSPPSHQQGAGIATPIMGYDAAGNGALTGPARYPLGAPYTTIKGGDKQQQHWLSQLDYQMLPGPAMTGGLGAPAGLDADAKALLPPNILPSDFPLFRDVSNPLQPYDNGYYELNEYDVQMLNQGAHQSW